MKATDCEHGNPWDECGECAIAAAEERGRRAGSEGVDKLRSEAEAGLADALNAEMKYRRLRDDQTANFHAGRGCVYRWAIPMLAALAPRDSGTAKPESDADFIGRIEKGFRK